MTQEFIAPLQEAVFNRLAADPDLSATVAAVYDAPVDGAAYPYIAFGETTTTAQDNKSSRGCLVNFAIDVWTDTRGQLAVKEIMAFIDSAMHASPFTLVGCDVIALRLERSSVREERASDSAPILTRGQLGYRVLLFQS